LAPVEYLLQLDRARRRVEISGVYRDMPEMMTTDAATLRQQFLEANPGLAAEALSLQCSGRWLKEVRVCVDDGFGFRQCGAADADHCGERIKLRVVRRRGGGQQE